MTGCGCEVLPSVRVGCCCLPLRCAAIVIGLVYEFLSMAAMYLFANLAEPTQMAESTANTYYVIFLTMICQFVAGLFLMASIIKKSPGWMSPWICVSFIQSAGLTVTAALCNFVYIYAHKSTQCCNWYIHQVTSGEIEDNPGEAVIYAVYAAYGIILYFATAVVNSYQKQLYAERADIDIEGAEMAPLSST